MTINRTTLLDLPLPVTGTESGVWGDVVNNGLSQYIDISVAGSLSLSADSDTNLSSTEGDASATNIGSTTAQYAILRCTGARTATRNINAPAWAISGGTLTNYSKIYIVVNETTGSQNIVLRATNSATPTYTTGVTIVPGERAVCAWNGSDFVKVGGAAGGSTTQIQFNNAGVFGGSANLTWDGTNVQIGATGALRLADTDSSNYVAFKSPGTVASNVTWTLPSADGTNGQALTTNGSGTLAFSTISTAAATPTTLGTVYGKTDSGSPYSSFLGYQAGNSTTASGNTAVGYQAGYSNTSGVGHTYMGYLAGYSGTIANLPNVAIGYAAMYTNTTGAANVAVGRDALYTTTGSYNTAVGYQAAYTQTTGTYSVALGYQALYSNNTGGYNVAVGRGALYTTTGSENTAVGQFALNMLTTGINNTAIGTGAGSSINTGSKNTILGAYSGNQDGLDIRSSSNYVVLSDGDGNRQASMAEGKSLALDSAVPQSGTGITFPATQSASSDANTLDDYEEGTFNFTMTGSGGVTGTQTYTSRLGYYTKIGNQVTITGYVEFATGGSGTISGNAQLTGLPFVPAQMVTAQIMWNRTNINFVEVFLFTNNSTTLSFYGNTAANSGNYNNITAANLYGTQFQTTFSFCYTI